MTLLDRLARWLNPCLHQWKLVQQLNDSEKNPTAATIIQACELCGDVRELTFRAPKTDKRCPPHKWETRQTVSIYRPDESRAKGNLPTRYEDVMECQFCGDRKIFRR